MSTLREGEGEWGDGERGKRTEGEQEGKRTQQAPPPLLLLSVYQLWVTGLFSHFLCDFSHSDEMGAGVRGSKEVNEGHWGHPSPRT